MEKRHNSLQSKRNYRFSTVASVFCFMVLFALCFVATGYGQNNTNVTGTVTSASDGATLPGVNISIKGTTTGTSSDANGDYSLAVPALNDTLVFSFVGFSIQEIPINGRNEINVTLESKTIQGKEAVVTAFGQRVQKEDVVGSVTSLDQTDLNNLRTAPTSNLTTSLAGRIPGLIAFQRSGEPGADNANFFVRGVSSFGYSNNPLILIDDIESSTTDLARLDPNNVASFSILKDATATSLYGSRAANGVLLIQTKQGSQGKAKVDLRIENSISMPTSNVDFADPIRYMKLENEAALTRDPLAPLPYSYRKIDKTEAGANPYLYPTVNWRDDLFKKYTSNQRANLNVSGGGAVATYFVSGSFSQDNGMLQVDPRNNFNSNIDLKNYSLRSNIDIDLTNTTQLGIKLSGNFDDYTGPIDGGAAIYREVVRSNPVRFPAVYPVTPDLSYVQHPLFGNYQDANAAQNNTFMLNPYADLVKGYKNKSRSNIKAQLKLKQDLTGVTQGLEMRGLVNIERYAYSDLSRSYNPYWYQAESTSIQGNNYKLIPLNEDQGTEYLNYNPGTKTVTSSFFAQAQLNYQRTFADVHGISGLLVLSARNQVEDNAVDVQTSLPRRNVNIAARTTYNYDKRYYAELNIGINASERFSKNNRWGYFPSFGVAWNVSNEDFWQSLKQTVNRLKFRATFGYSGNDNIGPRNERFLYLSNVNLNNGGRSYITGETGNFSRNGISVNRYSNPDITWARSRKLNLGMDLGLFQNLNYTIDVYTDYRTHILQDRNTIPATEGLQSVPKANLGIAKSRGVDMSLDYSYYFSNEWFMSVRGNFTFSKSEYVRYEDFNYKNEPWLSRIGNPVNQAYGYYADRLFGDQAEVDNSPHQNFGSYTGGDIKYRDINGDGQITTLDQVPLGYPTTPQMVYGFGFSTGYKSFDLSAFFQGLAHESFWIDASAQNTTNRTGTAPFVGNHQLLQVYANDHWSESNRNLYALWPRLSTNPAEGVQNNQQRNSWFLRDGSFLRVKEVQLGYSLPTALVSKLSMKELRVYVNGRNLITWSKFGLWDVEMAGQGLGYPLQRTFNIGVNLSF